MRWYRDWGWFHRSKTHVVVGSTGLALRHTSKALHFLLAFVTGLLVLASCLAAAAAWRLAQAPMDLERWSDRLRTVLTDETGPAHVSFDRVFLAWEGFHKGVDHPLDLRLSQVRITDQVGRPLVTAPAAHVTFSLSGILLGRMALREIEVDQAKITITREPGGAINLGWDPSPPAAFAAGSHDSGSLDLKQLRDQLSRPASSDHSRDRGLFDQIERAHFSDAEMTIRDREGGLILLTPDVNLDIVRARTGHIHGKLRAPLRVGNQQADLTAQADWAAGSETWVDLQLTALRPSGVGALPGALAFLQGIEVPVSLAAKVGLDTAFRLGWIQAEIQLARGQIHVGQGTLPIRSGVVALAGTIQAMTVTRGRFDLSPTLEGPPEIVDIMGKVTHEAGRLSASLTLGLENMNIADLPLIWPVGVGGGARPWVVEHVTAGTMTGGKASLVIESDDRLREIALTQANGELVGTNGTFTWIDTLLPVGQTDFKLHLVDPDTLDIHISSARQKTRNSGADVLVGDSQMRITGLSMKDQRAVIRVQVAAPVSAALSLLKEPRLSLLATHPLGLKLAAGDVSARLDIQLPLETKMAVDDIQIHAEAHLARLKLLNVVGGQDLDSGVFDLDIDKTGLALKGRGLVAAIPVAAEGTMDFNQGSPDQIVQKITLSTQLEPTKLRFGSLHTADFMNGLIPLTAVLVERRNGEGSMAISGDLSHTVLTIDPLGWHKSAGSGAVATATLLLSHDHPTMIEKITLRGDDLLLNGAADFTDGHFDTLRLDMFHLGRTEGHGSVQADTSGLIEIALRGDQIDLTSKLAEKTSADENATRETTEWALDTRFDHAILANGCHADDVVASVKGVGSLIRLLDVSGSLSAADEQPPHGFLIRIQPSFAGRHLQVETWDAGTFLRGIDAIQGVQSGHLVINGDLNRALGLYPLTGTATVDDVVIKNSPFLGKLLQAITLYGLVDVLRGPGMAFSRVVAPFGYDGANLNIHQAQASNASLGLTIDGSIKLGTGQTQMSGTIVPAYFFNSMLGHLPLVGKLFSPEKGGGVFAARFSVNGSIDDPKVSINPISALTPGFLREIFSVFDPAPSAEFTAPETTK